MAPDAVGAQVEAGRQSFVTACATCHGSSGNGGIGPPLAGRDLTFETIKDTVLNGRTGTPMPAFKSDFDAKTLAQIISYVQWITSGGRMPSAVIASESFEDLRATAARSSTPIAVGRNSGTPTRGATLFFDATQLQSCRTCHSFQGKGGPVGVDLKDVHYTPEQIYERITRPSVASSGFPGVALVLRDGTRATGVKSQDTADSLAFFDVSSLPPVKITVLKSEIVQVAELKNSGVYDHTRLPFSDQDLLDLSAYLGQPGGPVRNQADRPER
jgi:putative heme-binding domain-containing protein